MGSSIETMDFEPAEIEDGYTSGDRIEDLDASSVRPAAAPQQVDETAPIPGGGPLLEEEDEKKVFKMIDAEVRSQERVAKNRDEEDKHYDRIRRGVGFSFLEKSEDQSVIKAALPPGVDDVSQPVPNKIDDLCTKIVSQLMVDAYLPNPKPDGDSDQNRGAADLMKKFLRNDGGPSGTNDMLMLRQALTAIMTRSASFAYCWVDPTAGGWRPKQVKAHPQGTDPKNPLMGPRIDPNTQQPAIDQMGQPVLERATNPILRYVAEVPDPEASAATGAEIMKEVFTPNASEAARLWLPKHRRKDLMRSQVRTVPRSANVFTAESTIVLMWETVREARKRFKVLDGMSKDEIRKLCAWKPLRWKAIVPESQRPKGEDSETGSDSSLLFWYAQFCRVGDEYQDGGEVHVNGAEGGFLLKRDTLREDVALEDGTTMPILMDPPITEFIGLQSMADRGDPQGRPPLEAFAGAGELYQHLILAILDALDKGLNPNIYLSSTSTVSREDINRRDGTPIEILTAEDKPAYEEPFELPNFTPQILERVELALNSAAQTNETGNGLDSKYSDSGVAKDISRQLAKVMLAQIWQNAVAGLTYWWRIKGQLAQARLTVPQIVKLSGQDSAYKQRWFVGTDLVGTSDVTLAPGSGTMMGPAEKVNWLASLQQNKWITAEQAGELIRAAMADDLGLPPDVHEERINREIADWVEGPPPGWDEQYAAYQQFQTATQQAVADLAQQGVDPAIAQQTVQQQMAAQPAPPPPSTPFEPRPNDEEPYVAAIRANKLSRLMSTVDYTKHPKPWRVWCVDQEYARMAPAAGIVTVRQQQEAAAQQAQTQQANALALESSKHAAQTQANDQNGQLAAQDREFTAGENEKQRAAAAQHDDKSLAADLEKEVIRSTARGAPRATPSAPSASGASHS